MPTPYLPSKCRIILVEPSRPANVGAVARAMKTTGFTQLCLVASEAHRQPEAHWVAHGATELLAQAEVFADLATAVADCDLIIGTTARRRHEQRPCLTPEQLADKLLPEDGQLALVFGREASGLTNDELALCDLLSYAPLAVDYPSLNLAQAVMLYCYVLSRNSLTERRKFPDESDDDASLKALQGKLQQLVAAVVPDNDRVLQPWLMQNAALLSCRDRRLAHQLLGNLLAKLEK